MAASAHAGPWVQGEDEAFLRAALALEDHDGLEAWRGDFYGEWALTKRWTLSGKYEQVDFRDSDSFDSHGWRATARRQLWQSGNWTATAEVGLLEGAAIGGFRGCERIGTELGLGLGYGVSSPLLGDVYAGGMFQRRQHDGDCYHDRFEGVVGYTGPKGWMVTGQLWSERGELDRSDKVEWMLSRHWRGLQPGVGVRREVSGRFEETALVIALAYQP